MAHTLFPTISLTILIKPNSLIKPTSDASGKNSEIIYIIHSISRHHQASPRHLLTLTTFSSKYFLYQHHVVYSTILAPYQGRYRGQQRPLATQLDISGSVPHLHGRHCRNKLPSHPAAPNHCSGCRLDSRRGSSLRPHSMPGMSCCQ